MVRLEAQPVRADGVPEVMAPAHGLAQIKGKILLPTGPEKVVEDAQAVLVVQGLGPAVQLAEALSQVGVYPVKERAGLLDVLPGHGDGDVLILHQIVALRRLFRQDAVILLAVLVQLVPVQTHEDTALKIGGVETAVVDGDFGCGVGRQAVQYAAVGRKHIPLVLIGSQSIVDVSETPRLAEFAAHLPNTVPVNAPDGNGLLDAAGYREMLPFAPVGGGQGLNHSRASPFC